MKAAILSVALFLALSCAQAQTNWALEFNGISDFISLTTSPLYGKTSNFTLEAWANPTTWTTAHRILSDETTDSAGTRGVGFGTRDTKWRLTTYFVQDYDTAADTMTTGVWTHIAVTFDASNTATFYKNGQFLASIAPTKGAMRESTGPMEIGRNPILTEYWQGRVDEIRVWDYCRSAGEILDKWNRPLLGTESGLLAYYPFNEGTGSSTLDGSSKGINGNLNGCTWVAGPPLGPATEADKAWSQYP